MAWELTGNDGTDPGTNFLGTTDGQPLVIKTNGEEAMRINAADPSTSRVEIPAQDGLSVTSFQPFITLRDTNAGSARSIVQGVDGHIVLIPDSFIGSGGAAMVVRTGSGNVGIGTSDPSSRLEILAQDGMAVTGFQPFITLRDTNAGNARSIVQGVDGHIVLIPDSFIGSGGAAMVVRTGSGNVGIGTSDPSNRLEVIASEGAAAVVGRGEASSSGVLGFGVGDSGVTGIHGDPRLQETTVSNDGARSGVFGASDVGAGLVGYARDPAQPGVLAFGGVRAVAMGHRLAGEFAGDVQVDGDILLPGADCAEQFDLDPDDPADAGDVVVISPTGSLQRSAKGYDKAVAGVVSGAGSYRPGIILGSRFGSARDAGGSEAPTAAAPARKPIALVGKVLCRVDAGYGAVDVGDLLTTSDTPGHAMRADDPTRAFGSVLGKALGRLSEGRGLVPILVCLQ